MAASPSSPPSSSSSPTSPVTPTSLHEPPPVLSPAQLEQSTSRLYASKHQQSAESAHVGKYAHIRRELDWEYHSIPCPERQQLQDAIVDASLARVANDKDWRERHCSKGIDNSNRDRPIALFTAGGMGAGKGHTLKQLLKDGHLRLPSDFVWVDPDSLARSLPEREQYIRADPKTASKKLHPEAALLQEILSGVAKLERRPLVIDGSLSDCAWFGRLMKSYREDGYACEILFVTAPEATMIARAERRAKATGRYTDPEAIKRSRMKSPECVANLSKPSFVQRVRLVDNSSDEAPARILYDSARDPDWHPSDPLTDRIPSCQDMRKEAGVDVKAFVEGRLEQTEADGRVRSKERARQEDELENDARTRGVDEKGVTHQGPGRGRM